MGKTVSYIVGLAEYPYLTVWCKQYWVNVIGWLRQCLQEQIALKATFVLPLEFWLWLKDTVEESSLWEGSWSLKDEGRKKRGRETVQLGVWKELLSNTHCITADYFSKQTTSICNKDVVYLKAPGQGTYQTPLLQQEIIMWTPILQNGQK